MDSPMPDADIGPLTAEDLAALGMQSPLPAVPADTTNAFAGDAAAARLGQMLFFDKSYAGAIAAAAADTGTNSGVGATYSPSITVKETPIWCPPTRQAHGSRLPGVPKTLNQ